MKTINLNQVNRNLDSAWVNLTVIASDLRSNGLEANAKAIEALLEPLQNLNEEVIDIKGVLGRYGY